DDLAHRIPYNDRGPVAEVAHAVDQLHGEVLAALFPPEAPSRSKKRSAPGGVTRLLRPSRAALLKSAKCGHDLVSNAGVFGAEDSAAIENESRVLSIAATEAAPVAFPQTKKSVLTDDEEDKLREEQDPAKRIELYLAFAQDRLDRFVNFRSKPADPNYDTGEYLDRLLGEYVAVDDELKDWIEYQYGRSGDMRAGLRALLERGPRQLEQLRQVQQAPDAFARDYASSLRDAIDDLTDTLDGASKALADPAVAFVRVFRRMGLKRPLPDFRVEYHAYAGLRSTVVLRDNQVRVRLSDLLAESPPIVLEALAEILLAKLFRRPASREARECYLAYVFKESTRRRIEEARRERGGKIQRPARGWFFNLEEIFEDLNRRFFKGELPPMRLGWSA